MADSLTFSALIADVIKTSGRMDRVLDIVSFARATLRECQLKGVPSFARDMVELVVVPTATPFVWDRPSRFRGMRTVAYGITNEIYDPTYPPMLMPGRKQKGQTVYYYPSADSYVFVGVDTMQTIGIAYYSYAKAFLYYKLETDRPALYDAETETWSYHADVAATDEAQEAAREKVQHWLLRDWFDLIRQGTLTKIFQLNGDERARGTYALYKSQQFDLIAGERVMSVSE